MKKPVFIYIHIMNKMVNRLQQKVHLREKMLFYIASGQSLQKKDSTPVLFSFNQNIYLKNQAYIYLFLRPPHYTKSLIFLM